MNRRTQHSNPAERRGMKRSTRISMIAGVTVFLTLVSGVSFAAWTASSTKNATATSGAVAVTTATAGGAATISALGPFTYTATNQTVTKPITVRNTGTVNASLKSIAITRSGTLDGNQIAVKFWVGTSTACAAATPVVSTTLSGGTVSLSSLNLIIAASGSAFLCASTTFTGSMATQAGKSTSVTFAVNTTAGTNWNAIDSLAAASRTFTQNITAAPNAPTNTQCFNSSNENVITISWSAPSGFVTPNGGYNIYWNGSYLANTSNLSIGLQSSGGDTGNLTVRALASSGAESVDSANIPVEPRTSSGSGLACSN
ncbi:MAG: hypothetical protein ACOH1M_06585 [Rhodoglobus sp.]